MSDDATSDAIAQLRHDLRSPLALVIGFAELMAAERPMSEEQRRDLSDRVLRAAFEMRALIDSWE